MSYIMQVTRDNFDEAIRQSSIPVVVHFSAPWCGPCRVMNPALEELAETWDGQVRIAEINVDENQALAIKFRITSLPTLMVFVDGELEERITGALPKHVLENIIRRSLLPLAA